MYVPLNGRIYGCKIAWLKAIPIMFSLPKYIVCLFTKGSISDYNFPKRVISKGQYLKKYWPNTQLSIYGILQVLTSFQFFLSPIMQFFVFDLHDHWFLTLFSFFQKIESHAWYIWNHQDWFQIYILYWFSGWYLLRYWLLTFFYELKEIEIEPFVNR